MKTEQQSPRPIGEFQSISDTQLLNVINEMLEGVQIFDQNLNYLFINKAAERQNQRPSKELLGKKYADCWPGIEKTRVFEVIHQCLQNHNSADLENEFVFPDGSKGWFYLSIQSISGGLLILSLDVTGRKILGDEIASSERLYKSLFDNLLNGFAYCKMEFEAGVPLDFTYLEVNKSFEKLTGLVNVVGKRVTEVIPGIKETDPELFSIYGRVAATGNEETFEMFVEALQMWFFVTVYSPEKGFFVSIFDVVTERKTAEKKLNEQLVELQRWFTTTIGREERIIELKQEINQLLIETGKPPRYSDIGPIKKQSD